MNIFVIGINYKAAPVEIREKLSFHENEYGPVLRKLHALNGVSECVFISTCNRTEAYIYSEVQDFEYSCVEELLCRIKGLELWSMKKYFYFYKGHKAVKHIFHVAGGLDSAILFEDRILGQFKTSHEASLEAGTTSAVINTLFRQAITTAKKVKTYLESVKSCSTVHELAVGVIRDFYKDSLAGKCAVVIGTGKIGAAVIKKLTEEGLSKIYVARRTHSKISCDSQSEKGWDEIDYNNRYDVIDECDIVISATSSPHYTVTMDMLEASVTDRNKKRLFIDLAVPRDMDSTIKQLRFVRYYNIDDMKTAAGSQCTGEEEIISSVEDMISESIVEYKKWYEFKGVIPFMKEIQGVANGIVHEKTEAAASKLKLYSEKDKDILKASISGAVNSIMSRLVYHIDEYGSNEEREIYLRYLRDILKE